MIVGPYPSLIQDTISVTQPSGFEGDISLIQAELSKLKNVGDVTVKADSITPDFAGQCSWSVTFESKAGNLPSLQVSSSSGPPAFDRSATLSNGDTVSVLDNIVKGTSSAISGDFTLEFDGQRTGYLPHNVSANKLKKSLNSLKTIGRVEVSRYGPDVNDCYISDLSIIVSSLKVIYPIWKQSLMV